MSQSLCVDQLREVRLYGALGKKFGKVHRLAVKSCREAAQALAHMLPGFGQDVIDHEAGFHVFAGSRDVEGNIGTDALDSPISDGQAVFFVPVIAGRKSGVLQTVLGVALFAATWYAPYVSIWSEAALMLGAGMAVGGMIQMAMPVASTGTASEQQSSYRFSGPANVTKQGVGVPVAYGEVIAGSVVASQGLKSVEKAIE